MAKAFKKRSKKLEVAKNLPPSYHKLPGQEYDVNKSEAVQWLIKQPPILEFVWDQLKQSDEITYNPETKKWQGANYDN
ncbi:MAG TPA: hypothetical protein IAC41_09230 [Candidatus Merdenecus merdavium]|nr:hypothetical protein [Candidatus Merdenecus merdavium]